MKIFKYVLLAIFLVSIFSFISGAALFNLGNGSKEIQQNYAYGDNLKGWVNISLKQVPFNSLFTFYNSNISVYDLLSTVNSFTVGNQFNCSTPDCGMTYETSDSGGSTKSFSLGEGESKVIGLKITSLDNVDLNSLLINVSSSASESCVNQLSIDVGADGNVDLKNLDKSSSYCGSENYGCYATSTSSSTLLSNTDYCETIQIDSAAALLVGADIAGSGSAEFKLTTNDQSCTNSTPVNGRITCEFNMSVEQPTNFSVCVSQISGDYQIFYENLGKVCGQSNGNTNYDFSIFARPLQFSSVGNKLLNTTELPSYSDQDCSNGCILPIKFISGASQTITLHSINLSYVVGSAISGNANSIYSLKSTPSLISSGYNLIYLDNAGLVVPTVAGKSNISLKLNGSELFKIPVEVLSLPIIDQVYPVSVPAAIDYTFKVFASGNISSYKWDFGDNSTLETINGSAKHKYLSLGSKTLVLTAKNANGEVNKSFTITVISPAGFINGTLETFRLNAVKLNAQVSNFPPLVKTYLESQYNLSQIDSIITSIKNQYQNAGNDSEQYISILSGLDQYNLPNSLNVSAKSTGAFIIDKTKIKLEDVKKFTGEEISSPEALLATSASGWFSENLNVDSDFRVYSAVYSSGLNHVVTYLKLNIVSAKSFDKVYLVLPGIVNAQTNSGELKNMGSFSVLELASLSSDSIKSVELIVPGRVSLTDVPIYLFPQISDLSQNFAISSCNNNKVCDSSSGETYKNCRSDCSPWNLAIIWFIVLFIILLVIYILLQEWYKRNYENTLFKNKNDLYNLMNFISNSEKQGLTRDEMYTKLKEKGWTIEQINYAYNKFKGKRTGMWEIPIFRFWESKEMNKQLSNMPIGTGVAPTPMNPFIRKNNVPLNSNPIMPSHHFRPSTPLNNSTLGSKVVNSKNITPKDVQKTVFGNANRITNTTGYRAVNTNNTLKVDVKPAANNSIKDDKSSTKSEGEAKKS